MLVKNLTTQLVRFIIIEIVMLFDIVCLPDDVDDNEPYSLLLRLIKNHNLYNMN